MLRIGTAHHLWSGSTETCLNVSRMRKYLSEMKNCNYPYFVYTIVEIPLEEPPQEIIIGEDKVGYFEVNDDSTWWKSLSWRMRRRMRIVRDFISQTWK